MYGNFWFSHGVFVVINVPLEVFYMDMDRPGPWKRKKGNSTWIQSSLLKILRSNGPGLDMELTIVKLLVFILRIQNEQIHHLVLNHDRQGSAKQTLKFLCFWRRWKFKKRRYLRRKVYFLFFINLLEVRAINSHLEFFVSLFRRKNLSRKKETPRCVSFAQAW